MDIIITIPGNILWEDYLKEIHNVQDGDEMMLFRVPVLPKKANPGDRCYLCYHGSIVGFMNITWMGHLDGFECTTTGACWDVGNYIGRNGSFYQPEDNIPYKGFQGFRYAPEEWRNMTFREQRIQINNTLIYA